jgi:DNA-binding transcriptional ArsR family regulator
MEINVYYHFEEFKNNLLLNYEKEKETRYIDFLKKQKTIYEELLLDLPYKDIVLKNDIVNEIIEEQERNDNQDLLCLIDSSLLIDDFINELFEDLETQIFSIIDDRQALKKIIELANQKEINVEEIEKIVSEYSAETDKIKALEEELYILYSENERNEALIESKEDELDELIEEQTIKSLEWVQKLKYKITLKKRAEEFISEIRNIIQYIDNEVENVENLIKYTSTDEIVHEKETEKKIKPLKDAETGIDIDLLKYLSDNFKGGKTPLTKYNQIYRYFNDGEGINIPQMPYKKLIEKLFGFNYGKSDITRAITKHTNALKNHAINYKDSKK